MADNWIEWLLGHAVSGAVSGGTRHALESLGRTGNKSAWGERVFGPGFDERVTWMFNLADRSRRDRREFIDGISQNVFNCVMLEILTRLPREQHPQLVKLITQDRSENIVSLLRPSIGDVDAFMQAEVSRELEETRKRILEILREDGYDV